MSEETPPYQTASSNNGLETDPDARLWGMLAKFAIGTAIVWYAMSARRSETKP